MYQRMNVPFPDCCEQGSIQGLNLTQMDVVSDPLVSGRFKCPAVRSITPVRSHLSPYKTEKCCNKQSNILFIVGNHKYPYF